VFKGVRQWTLSRLHFHGLILHTLMLFPSMHILPSCILPLNCSIKILDTSHYHACYIVRLFDPPNHVNAEYAAPRPAQSVTSTVLTNTESLPFAQHQTLPDRPRFTYQPRPPLASLSILPI